MLRVPALKLAAKVWIVECPESLQVFGYLHGAPSWVEKMDTKRDRSSSDTGKPGHPEKILHPRGNIRSVPWSIDDCSSGSPRERNRLGAPPGKLLSPLISQSLPKNSVEARSASGERSEMFLEYPCSQLSV